MQINEIKEINVYFNRCFTDTAKVIEELKNNTDKISYKIFITHPVQNRYLEEASDFYEIEPELKSSEEYKNYCLNFCLAHNIDIFIPRYRAAELVRYKKDFKRHKIKVLFAGNEETYSFVNNKALVYNDLKDTFITNIPPFKVIKNYEDFLEGYKIIKNAGFNVCIKPVTGIGAQGFKIIKENINPLDELCFSSSSVTYEHLEEIIKKSGSFPDMLLSGVLPDEEWSVDCFAQNGILIDAAVRIKDADGRAQKVIINKGIFKVCQTLTERYSLDNLFNIQFKAKGSKLYFLEINPRMSAGIFKSCKIGINFLHKAVMAAFGKKIKRETYNYPNIKVITHETFFVQKLSEDFM